MAITYPLLTGWSDSFASSSSRSKDLSTGSNRYLVVLTGNTDPATSVTGVTVAGNAMTALNALYSDPSSRDWRAFGYDVSGLSGGQTIAASYSGTPSTGAAWTVALVIKGGGSLTIANVLACLNSNTDGGGGSDPARVITTATGDAAICLAIDLSGATPAGLSGDTIITSDNGIADAAYEVASGSSTTVGLDYGAFIETVTIGFSVTESGVAPTLTNPLAVGGVLTGSGSVSTDTSGGNLWWKVDAAGTATDPGAGSEAGAGWTSQAVSATGVQSISSFGVLTAGWHVANYLHVDGSGNRSTIARSLQFSVAAEASFALQSDLYF